MDEQVLESLRSAEALYAEYLRLADEARIAERSAPEADVDRSASYPVGFVLDRRAVHALVG